MNHWIVIPIVLPALIASVIVLAARHQLALARVLSVAGAAALVLVAVALMVAASGGAIESYQLGNWDAPFGIVMVLDRLSALMVLLTAILGLFIVLYVIGTGWDARGRHFHALLHFLLMGVAGAFLTGDAFNLFVFFEVLLIASYGLMIHGGGRLRLRAGVQYVVYNLIGSTLFLFALGTLYATTGTLNMADLAERVAAMPQDDTGLVRVAAVLLLMVFAIKAALLPLHFWLPTTYAHAPGPVAALFSIMTKVGAYAILRIYTLIFGPDLALTEGLIGPWLLPAALLTLVAGSLGILGAARFERMVAFAAVASMGTLLIAVALFTPEGTVAALYYTIHSTFAMAALFLISDLVTQRRGAAEGGLRGSAPMAQTGLIAALFFAAAVAAAGLPPLSGFLGKLLVLDATRGIDLAPTVWAVILVTSLLMILGFARAGSVVFWKAHDAGTPAAAAAAAAPVLARPPAEALAFVAIFGILALLVAASVLAGPLTEALTATAAQLYDPQAYVAAVLGQR